MPLAAEETEKPCRPVLVFKQENSNWHITSMADLHEKSNVYTLFYILLDQKNKKEVVSLSCIEHFCWQWSQDFAALTEFVLLYYSEIDFFLNLLLKHLRKTKDSSLPAFLLRYQSFSKCLDNFEFIITPIYHQQILKMTTAVRKSNQKILDQWNLGT